MDNEEILNSSPLRVNGNTEPNNPFPDTTPEEIAYAILDEIGLQHIPNNQYYHFCLDIYIAMGYDATYFDDVYNIILSMKPEIEQEEKYYDFFLRISNFHTGNIDYSSLDGAAAGVYNIAVGVETFLPMVHGIKRTITQGGLFLNVVSDTKKHQTILLTPLAPSTQGSGLMVHYRVINTSTGEVFEYGNFNIPVINDGEISPTTDSTDKTYSRQKIDELIAGLESRITELENK